MESANITFAIRTKVELDGIIHHFVGATKRWFFVFSEPKRP
jgi:hypothetical protein